MLRASCRLTNQVYRPLEFLFSVAALTTLAENFLPQLISLPKVRRTLQNSPRPPKTLGPTSGADCSGRSGKMRLRIDGWRTLPLQAMVQNLVRSALSLTFVISAARVVFNVKARMTREATWQLELKGDLTKQRRVEAVDKLMSVLTLLVAAVFGLQAIGLDGKGGFPRSICLISHTTPCCALLYVCVD